LKIGFLHDFLVKINDIAQKSEKIIQPLIDFSEKLSTILTKAQDLLVKASVIGVILPVFIAPFAEAILIVERLRASIKVVTDNLQSLQDFVEEFDISNILADAISQTQIVKGK
jgi:hypothetical protein